MMESPQPPSSALPQKRYRWPPRRVPRDLSCAKEEEAQAAVGRAPDLGPTKRLLKEFVEGRAIARESVLAHLRKLQDDRRVSEADGRWQITTA